MIETATQMQSWLAREDLTLDELVDATDALLPQVAPEQSRYKVRARLDGRTIRYYTTRGLLPRPRSHQGGRARYGSAHLLRLLLIKKWQAEHLTLRQITARLAPLDDASVRAAVFPGADPTQTPPASPQARSLELAPGGRVEVPLTLLEDPGARARLADSLEALAAWLRATQAPKE